MIKYAQMHLNFPPSMLSGAMFCFTKIAEFDSLCFNFDHL